MRTKSIGKPEVNVVTLGCSKNMVDSEVMMGQLRANGFPVKHEKEDAHKDIVIINTCGFIERAKQESIDTILEFAELRKENHIRKLYVTGCLSQRYREDLQTEIPEVDAWFGTMELPLLLKRLGADYKRELIGERLLITPSHYAYLKISEGCNRTCSFCAIPLMRGNHISRPIEEIVAEAGTLVKRGVKEVMLIAQELTYYGLDIYKKRRLGELLHALAGVDGLEWIRLHYAYPSKFPLEILDVMKGHDNICNYLDMPLQHISDHILTLMRRQISKQEIYDLIGHIRSRVSGIALRSTMLVGFPGETEEDFRELLQFVEEMKFDRLGVFTYSHEENTHGFQLSDDVPEDLKQDRASQLMELQEKISFELNSKKIGRVYKTIIDRKEGNYYVGRTEYDSPEVDNEVLINANSVQLHTGTFASVLITHAEEFDLYGKII